MHIAVAARWLFGVTLAVALHSSAVFGQQRYTLDADDTWQSTDPIDPASPEGQLALARQALAADELAQAKDLAGGWIEVHDRHPMLPDAYLIRADALRAQGNYYLALFDYEFVARAFPASEAFVIALERELEIARLFIRGKKRKFWGMRIMNASDEAEELLIRIQERLPGSRLAEQAAMELADFYFARSKMGLAVDMYSIFIENHPNSSQISKARRRLISANLATFQSAEFDASGLHEARARLQELAVLEPAVAQQVGADALLSRIDELDARKLLLTAQWYLQVKDPISAEFIVRRLLQRYPRSVAATDALRFIEQVLPQLSPGALKDAPDYETLRRALLGVKSGAGDQTVGDATAPAARSDSP